MDRILQLEVIMGKSAQRFDRSEKRTKDADAAQTDINRIVERHRETGDLTHISEEVAMYGDFSQVVDYQTALNMTIAADASFMRLPPKIRSRVENDPVKFVAWYTDPENAAELIELGLKEDPAKAKAEPAVPEESPPPPEPNPPVAGG